MSLGLLCPGQGDQTPAMLGLLRGCDAARPALAAFTKVTGCDPFTLSAEDMEVNVVAQPLVCAFQLAVWAAVARALPHVGALAGYSVGELAAYGCAGALTPEDVIALARRRAELMDAAFAGGGVMVALRGLGHAAISALCVRHGAEIAIVNGFDRFVVGGDNASVAAVETEALARGAKTTRLSIHIPSHTSLMRPAVVPFMVALEQVEWRRPCAPVIAGTNGAPIFTPARAREVLSEQLATTVEWSACLDGLRERGCAVLLELGPGAGLARMARDRFPDLPARSVAEFQSLEGAVSWVAKALPE